MEGSDNLLHSWGTDTTSTAMFFLLVAGGVLLAVFVIYLLFEPFFAERRRKRHLNLMVGEDMPIHAPVDTLPPGLTRNGFVQMTCSHCRTNVFVLKARSYSELPCTNCGQMIPAARRDLLAFVKKFLRWLLYPSFQNRF